MSLSLAAAYADNIAVLDQGKLAAVGTPYEVLIAQRVEEVYHIHVRIIPDPDTG